jgi:hypothetical protein
MQRNAEKYESRQSCINKGFSQLLHNVYIASFCHLQNYYQRFSIQIKVLKVKGAVSIGSRPLRKTCLRLECP